MFNLPVDIIRHTYTLLLTDNPLEIFNFTEETFKKGEYDTLEEKGKLITFALKRNFEITKMPLFENNKLKMLFESENFTQNLHYLDLVENKELIYLIDEKSLTFHNVKNNLKILDWLINQSSPSFILNKIFMSDVIFDNNLKTLKWLFFQNPPCPWDEICFLMCIIYNRLEIIKWLYSQNPPSFCIFDENCCSLAVTKMNLEMLIWLRSQKPPCPWNKKTCLEISQYQKCTLIKDWILSQDE